MPQARNMSDWETAISKIVSTDEEENVIVRGRRLTDMVGKVTFTEMMYLLIRGESPTKGQVRVLDALLTASMEHGISPPSMISRCFASYGAPIQVAIGGGVLTFADWMGGAGEQLAKKMVEVVSIQKKTGADINADFLREAARRLVEEARCAGERLAGFGIPLHREDPRAPILLRLAREEGVFGTYCHLATLMEEELAKATGRRIPMNLDGVGAALVLDLGFPWQSTRIFIVTPRTVSMAAHYLEELNQETRWRHIRQDQINYQGDLEK